MGIRIMLTLDRLAFRQPPSSIGAVLNSERTLTPKRHTFGCCFADVHRCNSALVVYVVEDPIPNMLHPLYFLIR
jgi:hypothetical protein